MVEEPVFYTWTAQRDAQPLDIVSGQGARFQTADGGDFIDFGSMTWNAALGQHHPRMKRALMDAAEQGLVVTPNARFDDKTAAAAALLRVAPAGLGDGKVFFCLSGAEANENAIKIALLHGHEQGRRQIVHRSRSYHGATLAMLSVSGDPRRAAFATGFDLGIAWEDPYLAGPGAGGIEELLERHDPRQIAAIILEGVVGANGVTVWPRGYYRHIRALCDRHGILLILDEVLTGFGRTGRWFAVDHDGVCPDMITCGKALTAGYAPGGAVIVHPRVAHHFQDHALACGLTHYAHPLTVAATRAAIETYERDGLVARAERLGQQLEAGLAYMTSRRANLHHLRGIGLLWAFDVHERDGRPAASPRMSALVRALRQRRLHLHKRDHMLFLAPPLVTGEDELREGLERLEGAIADVFDGVGAEPA